MWANNKVVLDYLPGNIGDIRWWPGKHIDIRPQEGNEHVFLFVIEGGADSESTINASQPCWYLFLVNGCRALGEGTLPGLLAGGPATS